MDAVRGKLTKDRVTDKLKNEVHNLGSSTISNLKRELCDEYKQEGSGAKRRRKMPKRKCNKASKKKGTGKRSCFKKTQKVKRGEKTRGIRKKKQIVKKKKGNKKGRKTIKKVFRDIFS